ncbi:MAG: D-alanyl-D-alanine carboxypeptidase family protein [Pararhodobacter sp.]
MTARILRRLHDFRVLCAVLLLAVASVSATGGAASAQPFASLVMDVRTGEVLHASNATQRLHPASLTKMMTLYIAFEAVENGEIDLDTRVRISREAARQPPSRLGLREGQRIAFRYLIRAAALRSANDAATAIAEALEGSVEAFAQRMNRTARAIGMSRTNFRNPHGLTAEGHLSTARDMATLGRQLYFDYPQYYNIFSRLTDDAGIATVRNTNRRFLSSYRGADGIKTGFTSAAGYNLAAMAERNGVRILVVVMGARSSNHRHEQVTALMDRGFRMAPSRAAIRRPARPDYVRSPEDSGNGPAAGRVIRLQTAPTSSLFPRARPLPGQAPPEEMIAGIRDEVDAVIADIREPEGPEEPGADETADDPIIGALPPEGEEPVQIAAAAPEWSPLPQRRPEDGTPVAETPLTEEEVADFVEEAPPAPGQTALDVAAIQEQNGALIIPGLPPIPLAGAAPDRPAEVLAEAASNPVAQPELSGDAPAEEARTEESPVALAEAPLRPDPSLAPAESALRVGEDGRILWRDEEVLSAIAHEDPADPVLATTIVLTTRQTEDPPAPPPMPEIVTRVSTSGGRLWAVELGLYPSRFDAERVLLRLALSESASLGAGVRRVTPRSGRFAAEVHSLSQDEAETACLRLLARDQPCTVMTP